MPRREPPDLRRLQPHELRSERPSDLRLPQPTVTRVSPVRISIPQSPRVELRALEESDVDELHALIEENRAHLAEWLPWAAAQTREDTLRFVAWSREQLKDANGCQAAIVEQERIVGVIGAHGIDRQHTSTSLGYWLAADAQGRGTMTEALRAMLDEAFGPWGLHRVEIRASVENERSRALIERVGLTFEGVAREAFRLNGAFRDDAVYSMLASEWHARQAPRERAR